MEGQSGLSELPIVSAVEGCLLSGVPLYIWTIRLGQTVLIYSLVPRAPPFLPSVCDHTNTHEWKTGEKQGRPGSIHHTSGHKVDVGGRDQYSNRYIRTKLESKFLTSQDEQFLSRKGLESENAVEHSNGWSCALFWQLGPSLLTSTSCPSDIIHVMNAPRPSLF